MLVAELHGSTRAVRSGTRSSGSTRPRPSRVGIAWTTSACATQSAGVPTKRSCTRRSRCVCAREPEGAPARGAEAGGRDLLAAAYEVAHLFEEPSAVGLELGGEEVAGRRGRRLDLACRQPFAILGTSHFPPHLAVESVDNPPRQPSRPTPDVPLSPATGPVYALQSGR